ncbi:MAG: PEP-CTERM system TPR-repeat protein PrsT [Burkholderiales bacterium]|nr:PEP-CTERM system TPR-repeat protein PrsT [Burkholderiales bacterium]
MHAAWALHPIGAKFHPRQTPAQNPATSPVVQPAPWTFRWKATSLSLRDECKGRPMQVPGQKGEPRGPERVTTIVRNRGMMARNLPVAAAHGTFNRHRSLSGLPMRQARFSRLPRLALSRVGTLSLTLVLVAALAGCESPESLERSAGEYLARGDRLAASLQYRAVLAKDAGRAEAHFQLGRILADCGAWPEAENYLKRALELGKPAADVIAVLGPVLIELEKHKELLALLEPDPKRPLPNDPKVLAEHAILRGYALLGQRDATGANTQFQLGLAALPDRAKLGLARVAAARNERAEAERLVGEVIASHPDNVDARLARAEMLRGAGQAEKALAEYAEAARIAPGRLDARMSYAIALIASGRVADARPLLDETRKTTPPMPMLYFAEALIDCREKRYQQCGDNLERVFVVLPRYMPAVLLAGQKHFATGNLETAQDAFLRYLERYPGDLHARKMLAATLLAKNQPQGALNLLLSMREAARDDPQLLGLTGQAYLMLGDLRQALESLAKAVKVAPGDPEARTALAMTHLAGGLRRRAEADFRAAVALKPDNPKADYGLIMLLLGENRVEPARDAVAALEQRLPKNPETYMLKGVVARHAREFPAARAAFQRARELDPSFFPAIQELAEMDMLDGKPDAARARLQEVLKGAPTHLAAQLALAQVELRSGRRAEGLASARRAADAHPGSIDALLLVTEALAEAGELNEAIGAAQQAVKVRPRNPRTLKALGQLQMARKDYGAAATTFTTLTSAQPGSVEAVLLLASAHMAAGDLRTAVAVARAALKRNPRNPEARELVGNILLQAKRYPEAMELAQALQRNSPKAALGYWLEGRTWIAQGEARRAVKPFETAVRLEPTAKMLISLHQAMAQASPGSERDGSIEEWVRKHPEDTATRMYLADALGARGKLKDAISHYESIVRDNPMDARALNNLAWALGKSGDPRAIEFAERAFQISPATAAVLDTYGWALVNRGKLHEGIQMLLKAVSLETSNPEIRYHLAKALIKAGDRARARLELKAALGGSGAFPEAEEARALLASLGT